MGLARAVALYLPEEEEEDPQPGQKPKRRHKTASELLRQMLLDPKFQFGRRLETLQRGIAANDEETKQLLLQIGARPNLKSEGKNIWTLQAIAKIADPGLSQPLA